MNYSELTTWNKTHSYLLQLPTEILLEILHYLLPFVASFARCCKSVRNVLREHDLWKAIAEAKLGKGRFLILGGCGFIGRNLVEYLYLNDRATKIVVADKTRPNIAYLSTQHKTVFSTDIVTYVACDIAREVPIKKLFASEKFDFVIFVAGTFKHGSPYEIYYEQIFGAVPNAAKEALKQGVKRFVFVSGAEMCDPKSKPKPNEASSLKPCTNLAKVQEEAENFLRTKMKDLNYVIVRPALVYGPGDLGLLSRLLLWGVVYREMNEPLVWYWKPHLKLNTVHVADVCAALSKLCNIGIRGEVYNLVDENDTDLHKLSKHVEHMFGIKTEHLASLKRGLININPTKSKAVCELMNDKHLTAWITYLKSRQIQNTPVTIYLDQEEFMHCGISMDGAKMRNLGFKYQHPMVTEELLKDMLKYWIDTNLLPADVI